MSKPSTTLHDLPDELVLELVRHFSYIPYGPLLSTTLARQCSNGERRPTNRESQLTLHSLCLTSRRLRKIATPFLYASFSEMPTWHGPEPLQLFLRTISCPKPGIGLQVRFVTYLQYVESSSQEEIHRCRPWNQPAKESDQMTAHYFQLLARIVECATDLRSLFVVSTETDDISFWKHILLTESHSSSTLNCLQKLQFSNFGGHWWNTNSALYNRVFQAMVYLPMLEDVRALGIFSDRPTFSLHGTFKSVQRLDFPACGLSIEDVGKLLAACNGLLHFTCSWSTLPTYTKPSEFYAGLLRHRTSLKTMHVDIRSAYHNCAGFAHGSRLGSLQDFTALESLGICERLLLGTVERQAAFLYPVSPPRISEVLPVDLKQLTLVVYNDYDIDSDKTSSLMNLAEDCQYHLPALKQVSVDCNTDLNASNLIKAFRAFNLTKPFEDAGVRFWYTGL
jgi:hypothetical protein